MAYFSNDQAKEIWKAKWQGVKVQALIAKYGENQFRLYEVWTGKKNAGSIEAAYEELKKENPALAAKTVPKLHVPTRVVLDKKMVPSDQLDMFDPAKDDKD